MPHAKQILSDLYKLKGQKAVAVFDLDSTLYNVSTRTQKILFDFSQDPNMGQRFLEQKARLKTIQVLPSDWGIRESLVREQIAAPLDFFEELRNYWRKHFFSNDYLHHDVPYEGAVEYVNAIKDSGVEIMYLTGRDRPDMFEGTVKGLKASGFPLENEARQLFMKPAKNFGEDEDYKVQILAQITKEFESVYFFENEPVIINKVIKSGLPVKVVFLDTVHSRRENVEGLPFIKGRFER